MGLTSQERCALATYRLSDMKCLIDGVDLAMSERQGIEIDDGPTCRGVWLDRGELDKIIERCFAALGQSSSSQRRSDSSPQYDEPPDRQADGRHRDDTRGHAHDDGDRRGRQDHDSRRAGRRSFLGGLFDFGD